MFTQSLSELWGAIREQIEYLLAFIGAVGLITGWTLLQLVRLAWREKKKARPRASKGKASAMKPASPWYKKHSFTIVAALALVILLGILAAAGYSVQNDLRKETVRLEDDLEIATWKPDEKELSDMRILGGPVPLLQMPMVENTTTINGWVFKNVRFVGPCIVTFIGKTSILNTDVETNLETFLISTTPKDSPPGLIVLQDCTLENCVFSAHIGFLGGVDESKELDEIQHMRDCVVPETIMSDNFTIWNWP